MPVQRVQLVVEERPAAAQIGLEHGVADALDDRAIALLARAQARLGRAPLGHVDAGGDAPRACGRAVQDRPCRRDDLRSRAPERSTSASTSSTTSPCSARNSGTSAGVSGAAVDASAGRSARASRAGRQAAGRSPDAQAPPAVGVADATSSRAARPRAARNRRWASTCALPGLGLGDVARHVHAADDRAGGVADGDDVVAVDGRPRTPRSRPDVRRSRRARRGRCGEQLRGALGGHASPRAGPRAPRGASRGARARALDEREAQVAVVDEHGHVGQVGGQRAVARARGVHARRPRAGGASGAELDQAAATATQRAGDARVQPSASTWTMLARRPARRRARPVGANAASSSSSAPARVAVAALERRAPASP